MYNVSVKISVIIPVYNCRGYFEECLQSVQSQTLKCLEIIVIDDCSDDFDYGAYIRTLNDNRIKFYRNAKRKGVSFCRNYGIKISSGVYISFLDGDDFFPDKTSLAQLLQLSEKKQLDICGGSLVIVDKTSHPVNWKFSGQYFDKCGSLEYKDYQHDGGFYRFIYRKEFIYKENLIFPELERMQDPVFFVNAMLATKNIYVIDTYVYAYRKLHKKIYWSQKKVLDHYSAVKTIMSIASDKNLSHLHYLMVKNFYHFSIRNLHKVGSLNAQFTLVWSFLKIINFKLLSEKWPSDSESFCRPKVFSVLFINKFFNLWRKFQS